MQNTTVAASGMNRKRATPNNITTGKNTMQIASVATVSGWITSPAASRIATVSGFAAARFRVGVLRRGRCVVGQEADRKRQPAQCHQVDAVAGQEQPDDPGEHR